jgi:hypothetical protein
LVNHTKTAAVLLLWMLLLRLHALLFVTFPVNYASGLLASGGLLLITMLVVVAYPPVTPAWRTVGWTFVLSGLVGAVAIAAVPGSRVGAFVALLAGLLVLALRCNGNGRRLWRGTRDRRAGRAAGRSANTARSESGQRSRERRSLGLDRKASGST